MNAKYIQRTRNILFTLGCLFLVLFGAPVISTFMAFKLASTLGCHLSAAGASECLLWGVDIGEILYIHAVPIVGMILAPLALVVFLWKGILTWYLALILLHFLMRYAEKQEKFNFQS